MVSHPPSGAVAGRARFPAARREMVRVRRRRFDEIRMHRRAVSADALAVAHRSDLAPILGDVDQIGVRDDGVVRRLLVSQIERVGAICYPSDDLSGAIRLLSAEPRTSTVMIDFALAGSDMQSWVNQVRAVRPDATIIGTGGVGAESDLLAQGVSRVLRKPWRINDLVDAIED